MNKNKSDFLYPHYPYRGQWSPKNLTFNANLQEFSQKVGYISSLQTNGKLSPSQAYREIKYIWKQLKRSKKKLDIISKEN
jgi:hypothetical protein